MVTLAGDNRRQPETTLKRRLSPLLALKTRNLRRRETLETTFLKVTHMREGKSRLVAISSGTDGVGKRLSPVSPVAASEAK